MNEKLCIGCTEFESCDLNPLDYHDDGKGALCPIWSYSCYECAYRIELIDKLITAINFQKENPIRQYHYTAENQLVYVEGWRKGLEMAKTIVVSTVPS
jgi:hypothetical protein